jgi:hypothetical protein
MKSKLPFLCGVLFLIAGLPSPAWAQAVGEIVGVVKDPSGAVIPSAKVTAVQEGTGFTRSTVSGSSGTYSLPDLRVGTYDVTAEAKGFKEATSTGITLDVTQHREVDFTLGLAGTTQTVEVTAAPPSLDTTDATIAGLVNGQQVSTLPLNGRDINNLVMMQPGVNMEMDSSLPGFSGGVAGNGNRGTTGSSYLDSSDTSDNELGGAQFTNFNLDAIAEFKVLQNNYSAQYGRGSGTVVELVSKSGTNQLHGSLFEFLRNSALDARNFFGSDVAPFRRNEFGGTLGGPVKVPGIYSGSDRTFFFVQYAGYRQRLGEPAIFSVPTAQERQGIVAITGANGQADQLTVPLNPIAASILNRYPLPNDPTGPDGPRTYDSNASLPVNRDQWSARVDHRFSSKDSMFGRFTWSNNILRATDPVALTLGSNFSSSVRWNQRNVGLTETHIFSPTMLNTFSAGYTMNDDFYGPGTEAIPQFVPTDGSLANWGPDPGIFDLHPETFTYHDAVDWAKNVHAMNFGIEYRRVRDDEYGGSVGGPAGIFFFPPGQPLPVAIPSQSGNNNIPAGAGSPNSLISFMEGADSFYQRDVPYPGFGPPGGGFAPFGIRRYHLNAWFQDDIKVTQKLTFNLGVRYEYNSVPYEAAGRFGGIIDDPNFQGGSLYRKLVLNPQPAYYPDYHGWGPRVGFAYRVAEKTVLRGGFGIFTNLPLTQTADQQAFGFPYASVGSVSNAPISLSPLPVAGLPVLTDLSGKPMPPNNNTKLIPPNDPVNLVPVAALFGNLLVNYTDMNFHNGYTMAGNFTLERQLPGDVVFQVAYVTNNAVGLYASEWPNGYVGGLPQYNLYSAATPGLGEFQLTDNHAHSTYNSLQVMTRKVSPSHGITFQASYTWSKAIDNANTVFNGPGTTQNNPFCWRCDKSLTAFNFPQRFVMNFIYNFPFDKWQALSSAPKRLTSGWQVTSIIQAQSGFPFTVFSPYGTSEYGTDQYIGFSSARPDLVQQPTLHTGAGPEEQFFSDAVVADGKNLTQKYFATPGALATGLQSHPGNLGRNTYRTGGFSNCDFSLVKDTTLTEGKTLQFRAEFFNLFNQHSFGIPGTTLGSPAFGVAGSTALAEREIQFGLRFIF